MSGKHQILELITTEKLSNRCLGTSIPVGILKQCHYFMLSYAVISSDLHLN